MPANPFVYRDASEIVPILADARHLIDTHGWTKGALFKQGCYCLEGAIRVAGASLGHHNRAPAVTDALRVVCFVIGRSAWSIIAVSQWNDDPRRKKAHVLKALVDSIAQASDIIEQCAAQAGGEAQEATDEP